MYTVYDFVNNEVSRKHMRLGWKIEMQQGKIVLRYTMLNFDWTSLNYIGDDLWNMFLNSASYANLRKCLSAAMDKKKRLYLDAYSISDLKILAKHFNIEVNIDKIVSKAIAKKSDAMKQKRKEIDESMSKANV